MIEDWLQRFITHPRRRVFVITLSFGIGLATGLPLVDEYDELRGRRTELESQLAEARLESENLERFERRVEERMAELENLEGKAVAGEQVNEFRGHVVALVRDAGCQLRRIHAGSAQGRNWMKEDNALRRAHRNTSKKDLTGFELLTQPFMLEVTGSIPQIRGLLEALQAEGRLAHTKSVSLRPAGAERKEVVLELEMWLFDLGRPSAVSA